MPEVSLQTWRSPDTEFEETHARDEQEFLQEVSRVIVSYIISGDSGAASDRARRFHEDRFLRKKWGNQPVLSPLCMLPTLQFQVALATALYTEPSPADVYKFLKKTFDQLRLPRELAVLSLIYVRRLILGGTELRSTNWKPVVYSALLVSSKIWEDVSVLNVDFSDTYKPYTLQSVNRMEREFADQLEWRLFITPDEYSDTFYSIQQNQRSKRS